MRRKRRAARRRPPSGGPQFNVKTLAGLTIQCKNGVLEYATVPVIVLVVLNDPPDMPLRNHLETIDLCAQVLHENSLLCYLSSKLHTLSVSNASLKRAEVGRNCAKRQPAVGARYLCSESVVGRLSVS